MHTPEPRKLEGGVMSSLAYYTRSTNQIMLSLKVCDFKI